MSLPRRGIKSFVLRQGRLTKGQQQALDTCWPRYGQDFSERLLDIAGLFDNPHPTVLEIGFGNGDSLVEQALRNPDENYIGIEVHRPGVGHCLHLASAQKLANLRVINHDAIEVLQHQIPQHSLHKVQLFFPDPWHKLRHHKRRILQQAFIDTVRAKLQHDGLLHLATDWEDYAKHMQREMAASEHFELASTERGERPLTRFEQRGLRLGHGVWDFVYRAV